MATSRPHRSCDRGATLRPLAASGLGGRAPPEDSSARYGSCVKLRNSPLNGFGIPHQPVPLGAGEAKVEVAAGGPRRPPAGGCCSWKTKPKASRSFQASGTCCRDQRLGSGAAAAEPGRPSAPKASATGASALDAVLDAHGWRLGLLARPSGP